MLTLGFAAKFNDDGMSEGLLQGRSVKVISTSDAPTFLYCINSIRKPNRNIWKKAIVEFCGMEFDDYHLYGGMDTHAKKVEKLLKSVKKLANS